MLPVVPAIGSRQHGWYGEIAWNLLARVRGSSQALSPFVRFESLDTQDGVAPGFVADPANDRTVRTYGLTYRPIQNIAVKIDYQDVRNGAGIGVHRIGFALGYLF